MKHITLLASRNVLWVTMFFLIGCKSENEKAQIDHRETKILDAKRYIDQNQDDLAINLLEELNTENPGDHEILITLASAYAHRGGFKVQSLITIISEVNQKKVLWNSTQPDISPTLRALKQLCAFSDIYHRIPLISIGQKDDLDTAVLILNQVPENEFQPADALLRTALRLFLFRHHLGRPTPLVAGQEKVEFCKQGYNNIIHRIIRAGQTLSLALADASLAQPQAKDSFQSNIAAINESIAQLKLNKSYSTLSSEAMMIYLQFDNSDFSSAMLNCDLKEML